MKSSQQSRKRKTKDDCGEPALPSDKLQSTFHEIHPTTPSPETELESFHTPVDIFNDDLGPADTSRKHCLPSMLVICFKNLVYACFACFAAVVGAVILILLISGLIFAAIVALPLLSVLFLVLRVLQFFRTGDGYDKIVQLKVFIRTLILLDILFYLGILWILFALSKRVSILKNVMFVGLSLVHWLNICNVIFGIYLLSYIMSLFTLNFIPLVSLDHNKESGLNVPQGVLEIIDCLIFWFAESEVMAQVPAFKHHKMLGLLIHKWIEVSILILIAYNVISLSTHMIVWFSQKYVCDKLNPGTDKKSHRYLVIEKFLHKKYMVYCVNGMKHDINFILCAVLLLSIWMFYIGYHLDEIPYAKSILKFGTRTCLSFLVCSIFLLIKRCVLLSWEACSVYSRLHSKILGGKQLYFLGLIGRHNYDIFNIVYECGNQVDNLCSDICNKLFPTRVMTLDAHYQEESDSEEMMIRGVNIKKLSKKKKTVKADLLTQQQNTMYCVQVVAGYLSITKNTLSHEKYTFNILQSLKSYSEPDGNGIPDIRKFLEEFIRGDDWEYFKCQLLEYVDSQNAISFERRLELWMEKSRNNCVFLANTLISAKEVVDCLNKIISWLLIVVTFIVWLLLTGLATTRVLILSPLLAATFVFGDTCKIIFQGIIFVFVVHPFDVGDLCVIDENMVEVRTIGIWKTTFSNVSTQEEVIYPNLELFNKHIINHKTNFDWNDSIELDVSSLDSNDIMNLKEFVNRKLNGDENRYLPAYNSVEASTTGDNIKITIHFRLNADLRNHTYFECLKEKRKLRSEFVHSVHAFIDRMRNQA